MIFRRHDGRMAEVEAGPLRMKVPLGDIVAIESEAEGENRTCRGGRSGRGITVRAQPSDEPAAEEINVIGCRVEEASGRVDKFLDEAALAGIPSVRIIHGHGMGALRRGLAESLQRIHWSRGFMRKRKIAAGRPSQSPIEIVTAQGAKRKTEWLKRDHLRRR